MQRQGVGRSAKLIMDWWVWGRKNSVSKIWFKKFPYIISPGHIFPSTLVSQKSVPFFLLLILKKSRPIGEACTEQSWNDWKYILVWLCFVDTCSHLAGINFMKKWFQSPRQKHFMGVWFWKQIFWNFWFQRK